MKRIIETPAQEAMRHARKLATLKTRRAMAPHVRRWADAMLRGISESYFQTARGR